MDPILKIACIVIAVLGLGMFVRAYHYGNQSMGRIGKSDKTDDQKIPSAN
jgi:O-antigen/teichoic acid export membrane protein